MLPKISIFNQALHSVQSGHPWLFESQATHDCPAGEPILLVAGNSNKIIGFGLADTGDISVRVLGKNPMQISFLLKERIAMAAHFRQSMARKDTDCYRLINGAGDGLPGIIADRYADTIVLRLYSKAWIRYIDIMIQEFKKLDGISRVYRKFGVRLVDGKKGGETLAGSPLPEYLIATEYGLKFIVRPKEGQKTGLFLDQREHRRLIGEISQDKTVVNLFSYNGGFSLYAAKGGAKRVYSVDISASALEDAKENFRLNGLNPDLHVFDATDAFKWVCPEKVDLFICDPPSLSKGRKSDNKAKSAYRDLAKLCSRQVPKGGLLATASCTARLSNKEWEKEIKEGVRGSGEWSWAWRSNEPFDHPIHLEHTEARYLKFALLMRRK